MGESIQPGDIVTVRGIVDKVPRGDRTLYRIKVIGEGQVIWCREDQIAKCEGWDCVHKSV